MVVKFFKGLIEYYKGLTEESKITDIYIEAIDIFLNIYKELDYWTNYIVPRNTKTEYKEYEFLFEAIQFYINKVSKLIYICIRLQKCQSWVSLNTKQSITLAKLTLNGLNFKIKRWLR